MSSGYVLRSGTPNESPGDSGGHPAFAPTLNSIAITYHGRRGKVRKSLRLVRNDGESIARRSGWRCWLAARIVVAADLVVGDSGGRSGYGLEAQRNSLRLHVPDFSDYRSCIWTGSGNRVYEAEPNIRA
jgi:hypothetical protein